MPYQSQTSLPTATKDNLAQAAIKDIGDRLFLGAFGPQTRYHMTLVWLVLGALLAVDVLWLAHSRLVFAITNWPDILRLLIVVAALLVMCAMIAHMLRADESPIAVFLRKATDRTALLAIGFLVVGLLATCVIMFCCLGSGLGLPLQDAWLAEIDRALGFDWVAFVSGINTNAIASWLLVKAYESTGYVLAGALVWFCVSGQGARLAELLALMCVTSVGIVAGMLILPAAGAYVHYQPSPEQFSNFSHNAGLWHYQLLLSFRNDIAPVIDFAMPNINCLVTFPSGHTILAIIMTYALRGSLWTLVPAAMINAAMLVSTIPEGGHHLIDLVVGAAIAAASIALIRWPARLTTRMPASASALARA